MIITAGKYKGRKVTAPDENITRPTLSKAREAVFSILFSLIDYEGKSFLDMFAGSGIMGLEALSRGFKSVLAVEKSPKVAKILKENYKNLGIAANSKQDIERQSRVGLPTHRHLIDDVLNSPQFNLVIADSLKLRTDKKFDVIYLDPPYLSGIYEKTLEKIKKDGLLNANGIIILEHITEVDWQNFGFELIKQKSYSKKLVTFLSEN
jgi:16S rRNA (guanine966-N2)-methyltransferase